MTEWQREISETLSFTIASKMSSGTVTTSVKEFYNKNFKTLKKEIKDSIRTGQDPPPHAHGFIGLIWPSFQDKSTNPIKFSTEFFTSASLEIVKT